MKKTILTTVAALSMLCTFAQWKPVGDKIKTPWAEKVDPANVLPEYPRPQMVRSQWVNLNGLWDYAIKPVGAMEPKTMDGKILVPFAVESSLSGVQKGLTEKDELWYRRTFSVPAAWKGSNVLLNFGAVDWKADVFVNDILAGSHTGGFTPFSLDITPYLKAKGEQKLVVRVFDGTDKGYQPRGKQVLNPNGIWYTPVSGIWQTVWAELVPERYIGSLLFTPELPEGRIRWQVFSAAPQGAKVSVCYQGEPVAEGGTDADGCGSAVIAPEQLHLWTPETPELYDVTVTLGADTVKSYFAMRTIGTGRDAAGHPCLLLNGEPYFHHGVLDQGYWPDGLYTAPSDEALIYDIQLMKRLGFNMLRKHIKIEPMRWYYHCDRLGMLVWQDMPSGGGRYNLLTISAPLITGIHLKDSHYRLFARTDPDGRDSFRQELEEMIRQLQNCPCIVLWVPFNEGWGQFDAKQITRLVRKLDPTRLIDHASGWHDQGVSDVRSLHVYFKPYRFRPDKKGRAVVLSEFGGYNLPVAGHTWNEKNFGYKGYQTPEALGEAVRKLYETQIIPARKAGLAADVYTQLSDVEDEVNGFVTYDRRVEKLPEALMQAIARELKGE